VAPESSARKSLQLQHVLYAIASLPFVLFAILWALGAFKGTPLDSSPIPSPSATPLSIPATKSQRNSKNPGANLSEDSRIDTARHHPPGKNAADFYKQAYALYQALNLSDDEKALLRNTTGKWDKEKADALYEKIQPVVEALRLAKDAAYADWGIEWKNFTDRVPQMMPAMDLSRVMTWNSAYEFPNNPGQALADLNIQVGIGRSVGQNALIGTLVNLAISTQALNTIRNNAASISPDLDDQVQSIIGGVSIADQFSDAMNAEKGALTVDIDLLERGEPVKGTLSDAEKQASPAVLIAQLKSLAAVEEEFGQKALLPETEYESWWDGVQKNTDLNLESQPVGTLSTMRNRIAYVTVQSNLLAAGLSVLQNGNSALSEYSDPMTGDAYKIVPNAAGFELQATYQYKGKPVTMQFPTPKP